MFFKPFDKYGCALSLLKYCLGAKLNKLHFMLKAKIEQFMIKIWEHSDQQLSAV
jgi:hypothetical protein